MTQAYEVQTIEAFGMPYIETRYYPEPTENEAQLITIEFKPHTHSMDDYCYSHPRFVFGDLVVLKEQWEYCQEHPVQQNEELDIFRICAIELVERRSKSGRLTSAPEWLYGIRCTTGTKELMWFDEDELMSGRELKPDSIVL
ncbi:hypothetical protein HC931_27150 [Candidatus Gracilibacteria bacterium]|nr:hypothetical protein [Candidatus Gracilibacteria bacterium]NJM90401.1 hypothetical protein [Hydrococcus sp. RU_2_2]